MFFAALNYRTGHLLTMSRKKQTSEEFSAFMRYLCLQYRGWNVALVLDSDSSHTSKGSRAAAQRLGILLLFLPFRAPELNPVDQLWGKAKQKICANRQYENIDELERRFSRYLRSLSPDEVLQKSGVRSPRFWFRAV